MAARFGTAGTRRAASAKMGRITAILVIGALSLPALADAVTTRVVVDSPEQIIIQVDLGAFEQSPVRIDGQTYTQLRLGKESPIKTKGAPELPTVCRSVVIPPDAQMDVRVLDATYDEYAGIKVTPSKGFLPRTVDPAEVPYTFGQAYAADAFYPGELASLREPYILRDVRGVVIDVYPFQYNPVTETLRVYTSLTVEVYRTGTGGPNVLVPRDRALSKAFHEIYKHHFLNYGTRYDPLDEEGELLVICYDEWLTNIQPFADHKDSIGIDTTVVPVSTAGSSGTAIKSYIQSVYDSSDLAFVLLVGDAAQVPSLTASGGASDPSYAKLEGGDDYPDIMVGRFSASTAAQVDTQVERTVEYEDNQATTQDWFWKGTGIASAQGAGVGDEGQSDYEHEDEIRQWLLDFGYTEVDQIYDTTGATAAMVTTALNEGRGVVNYTGHGSPTSWGTTGFDVGDINDLTNDNMLPFIITVACNNGEFDSYDTCFGEAWLRATNGTEPTGAIACYASSISQSWAPPMEAQDEAMILYTDSSEPYHCFGTLCFAGSCSMMDDYGGGGVDMYNTWIYFGDPTLRVIGVTYMPPVALELVGEPPEFIPPEEDYVLNVIVEDGREAYASGTAKLHYRYGLGPFIEVPLEQVEGTLYEATLPAPACDDAPQYYFSAVGDQGGTIYLPGDEETHGVFTATVATVTTLLADDFEIDQGWTVENVELEDGAWERAIPNCGGDRGDPPNDFDGSGYCFVTDNEDGNSDVDGGPTRLISPVLELAATHNPYICYARWFTNDDLDADCMTVEVSADGGATWAEVEAVYDSEEAEPAWVENTFYVSDYVDLTNQVVFRFNVADNPNNSITEAGVDAVLIVDVACETGLKGDMNCDGVVNYDDIDRFVEAMGYEGGVGWPYDCPWLNGDFTDDGVVGYDDIDPFVEKIGDAG